MPSPSPPTGDGGLDPGDLGDGGGGGGSWNPLATPAYNTALPSHLVQEQEELEDTWDLEEGDVEEFQMQKITELRKEEERKERKRIRERDKVSRKKGEIK